MKYLGLLAVVILALGLTYIVAHWPEGKRKTFSQRVAVARHRVVYYIALFSIALPLLLLFFLGWFVPEFGLSVWFSVFIVIAAVAQYACTLIPETGGWRTQVHRTLAGISGVSLIPPLTLVLSVSTISVPVKVLSIICAVIMVTTAYIALVSDEETDNFLNIQIVYYLAFFTPILYISYLM
ncbi:MAG TPA: hypothetical protein VLF62_01640 [Candidatus Saccharimonadales bacterium]|nr:hypothetical protein [Candidatus Saccharimonadales bacterium]